MTWPEHAPAHIGHRAKLLDLTHLRCFDCGMTLVIPLRPDLTATPTPPPWAPPTEPPATPEVVAAAKARALADLELVRQRRTEA